MLAPGSGTVTLLHHVPSALKVTQGYLGGSHLEPSVQAVAFHVFYSGEGVRKSSYPLARQDGESGCAAILCPSTVGLVLALGALLCV